MEKYKCDLCHILCAADQKITELIPWQGQKICYLCHDELTHWKKYSSEVLDDLRKQFETETFKIKIKNYNIFLSSRPYYILKNTFRKHGLIPIINMVGLGFKVLAFNSFVSSARLEKEYLRIDFVNSIPKKEKITIIDGTMAKLWVPEY